MISARGAVVLALLCLQCACTTVQPWERGYLARPDMAFEPDPLEARSKAHLYSSKEASAGGTGASTGGCGCN